MIKLVKLQTQIDTWMHTDETSRVSMVSQMNVNVETQLLINQDKQARQNTNLHHND